jgi:hypothetical protein
MMTMGDGTIAAMTMTNKKQESFEKKIHNIGRGAG